MCMDPIQLPRRATWTLLVGALATMLACCWLVDFDRILRRTPDDAYYFFKIAENVAKGSGATSIQQSQRLADSVVRYLVLHHQIPVYRIYELGLGNAAMKQASGERKAASAHGSRVEVTLLKNGVGDLQASQTTQSMSQPQ